MSRTRTLSGPRGAAFGSPPGGSPSGRSPAGWFLAPLLLVAALSTAPARAGDWSDPESQRIRLPPGAAAEKIDPAAIRAVLCIDRDGRVLAQIPSDPSGMVEVRGLTELAGFLGAVAAAGTGPDAAVLIQADESTRFEAISGLLASCAGQRLWRVSFAVAADGGMGFIPANLPADVGPPRRTTSVRLTLKSAENGRIHIAIGRKLFSSPADLTTALETLQALFPGLRLLLNVHADFAHRDLIQVLGIARATGFPAIEFSGSFVDPDEHPLVNTGVLLDPQALDVAALDPRNRGGSKPSSGPWSGTGDPPGTGTVDPAPAGGIGSAVTLDPKESRRALLRRWGGTDATERAVHAGLGWLVRHQAADGSWGSHSFGERCLASDACAGRGYKTYDVGVTALALYALVAAGCAPGSEAEPAHAAAAGLGLKWLVAQQDEAGGVGPADVLKPMYNHAVAALALCEACRAGGDDLRGPAQRAIDFLLAGRSPEKGWRYKPRASDHDTSVTGWALCALYSARAAGLRVESDVFRELEEYFEEATDERYARVGYTGKEDAGLKITVPGKNENYINHDTMTAIGIFAEILLDNRAGAPRLGFQVDMVGQDLPRWDKVHLTNDYYYWYYGTSALLAWGAPEDPDRKRWERWNAALIKALVDNQAAAGCSAGSWDADDRWSFEAGRVYATALNVLTLESYYRVPALLGSK